MKAVFIDRDGVLNKEVQHPELEDNEGRICTDVLSPDEFALFPGVQEACKKLKDLGYLTIIVSNQTGVAKGFISLNALDEIDTHMKQLLKPDAVYYCVHHEDYTGACDCKKPKKGMLEQAMKEHDINLSESFMIGDRRNDMLFGADCKHCFYVASRDEDATESIAMLPEEVQKKTTIVKDFPEAVEKITHA